MTELELPIGYDTHDVTLRLNDDDTADLAHRFPAGKIESEGTLLFDSVGLNAEIDTREVSQYTDFTVESEYFNSTAASKTTKEFLRVVLIADGVSWTGNPQNGDFERYGELDTSAWHGYITDSKETLKIQKNVTKPSQQRTHHTLKLQIEREFVAELFPSADCYVVTWRRQTGGALGSSGNEPSEQHTIDNLTVTEVVPETNE